MGTTFSSRCSIFLKSSKILLIYIILHIFKPLVFTCVSVLLNRIQGISLFTWEIYQKRTIFFFFVFFIFKGIFSVPMFERYHFQSECNPGNFWRLLLTFNIFSGCLWKVVQSNLYNPTTLGTTQKWLSWTGGHHIKHLYKRTPNQEQKSNWLWHKYSKLNYLVVPFRMVYLVNQGSI